MTRSIIPMILLCAAMVSPVRASALELDTERTFDPASGELPESIAIDDRGQVYLSMANTIRILRKDGTMEVFGTLPIDAFALGVAIGPDRCVYTASTSLDPAVVGAFVWRICQQGHVQEIAALDPASGPNDLAFDNRGNLYVTDTFQGRIYRVDRAGQVELWLSDPLLEGDPDDPALLFRSFGVNGIAFDKNKDNLYAGNLDAGQILRIPLDCDGDAGAIEIFASDALLVGADGIAFDEEGNLLVAVNAAERLIRISPTGQVAVLAEGAPLDSPSAVAFGTQGTDKRTLYITSSAVSRAFGLKPGIPMPALLSTSWENKGLRLP